MKRQASKDGGGMPRIAYISDQPKDYAAALDKVKSLIDLRAMLWTWQLLAADAFELAKGMTEADFEQWQTGHAKERKGEFAGEEYAMKFAVWLCHE